MKIFVSVLLAAVALAVSLWVIVQVNTIISEQIEGIQSAPPSASVIFDRNKGENAAVNFSRRAKEKG